MITAKSLEEAKANEANDSIDSYFECITTCSIDGEGAECETKCVEIHLKNES